MTHSKRPDFPVAPEWCGQIARHPHRNNGNFKGKRRSWRGSGCGREDRAAQAPSRTDTWRPSTTEEVWWALHSRQKRPLTVWRWGLRARYLLTPLMLSSSVLQPGCNPQKRWGERTELPEESPTQWSLP